MDAFVWDQRFVTGLDAVDTQHHRLVELVNQVGNFLLDNNGDEAALKKVFGELASYAIYHFAEEERLMAEMAVDRRHAERHANNHQDFVKQVVSMWERRAQSANPAAMLHGYLASWLSVHILGEDQVMARMIAAIRAGGDPAEAFEREVASTENSVSALLDALHKLYHVLSVQNRELADNNQSLEEKIAQRTQDLARANSRLVKEQDDLRLAMAHIEATHLQLLNSEKMASLGRMVAGFAHQLNTPIGIAVGAISNGEGVIAATERLLDGDEVSAEALQASFTQLREGTQLALNNLKHAAQLVHRIKQSSLDQDAMTRRIFSLQEIIDTVILNLRPRIAAGGVTLQVDCPAGLEINGIPELYEQVLNSLIGNALHHAFPVSGRQPLIRINVSRDREQALKIRCEDNGVGMPPEVSEHIFEPFFTTQHGTGRQGLGLYLCYNVVISRLFGTIDCTSTAGAGTSIQVRVPAASTEKQS